MSEEGGTKIQRRNVQQIPQQGSPNTGPTGPDQQQMMMQQQQMMMQQQQQQQMMQQQQQQQNYQQQPLMDQRNVIINNQIPNSIKNGKNYFKGVDFSNKNVKNSIIVVVLFILLNSRMIWKAIAKIPMMGTVEPSVLALIVNSLIAGIVFYIISTKVNKN